MKRNILAWSNLMGMGKWLILKKSRSFPRLTMHGVLRYGVAGFGTFLRPNLKICNPEFLLLKCLIKLPKAVLKYSVYIFQMVHIKILGGSTIFRSNSSLFLISDRQCHKLSFTPQKK